VPTDTCDKVPRHRARSHLEMGLDGHEVIGNSVGDGSLHGGREKLGEWTILVSWPQQHLTVIGGTQALIVAHRPAVLPAKVYAEQDSEGPRPASQGLSTLGGGYCHDLFPMLSPIHSPPPYLPQVTPPTSLKIPQAS